MIEASKRRYPRKYIAKQTPSKVSIPQRGHERSSGIATVWAQGRSQPVTCQHVQYTIQNEGTLSGACLCEYENHAPSIPSAVHVSDEREGQKFPNRLGIVPMHWNGKYNFVSCLVLDFFPLFVFYGYLCPTSPTHIFSQKFC